MNLDVKTATQAEYLQVCSDHSLRLSTALTIQQYQELVLDQVIVPKLQENCLTLYLIIQQNKQR